MDSCLSPKRNSGETPSPHGSESSFGIISAFRDIFADAFTAISVVHKKVCPYCLGLFSKDAKVSN
jgi:hypothetical protein